MSRMVVTHYFRTRELSKQVLINTRKRNTYTGHPKKITELRNYFNFGAQFFLTMIILIKKKTL